MSSRDSRPAGDLQRVFPRPRLRSLARGLAFERGEDYANGGRVTRLHLTPSTAEADVQGSALYHVRLWMEDGEPRFACSCPVGADGQFCKHAGCARAGSHRAQRPRKGNRDRR